MTTRARKGPLLAAGTLLGIGIGGFFDGILFHQILQWHQMLSSWLPPTDLVNAKVNMVWDGLFHAATWLATLAGIAMLWRATRDRDVPHATGVLVGAMGLGWGSFNVVEGLIDHQLLGVHHVHPGANQLAWDVGFLVVGALMVAGGAALIRR